MTEGPLGRYDGIVCDLDGVVYHGPDAIPGAVDGIAGLHDRGIPVGYVTNNATRTAEVVAEISANAYFRPYTNTDVVGVEMGGAVKNVIALAVGIADGQRLDEVGA